MDWNWAAIEATAAIAGVIGLIVSVIFLIYEVRHNARAIEGATVQNLMALEREVFALVGDNADLFTKGCNAIDSLSEAERFKFDRLVATVMSLLYSAYIQYQRGLIDDEVWQAYLNALRRWSSGPGFVTSWKGFENGYPNSFRTEVLPIVNAAMAQHSEIPT